LPPSRKYQLVACLPIPLSRLDCSPVQRWKVMAVHEKTWRFIQTANLTHRSRRLDSQLPDLCKFIAGRVAGVLAKKQQRERLLGNALIVPSAISKTADRRLCSYVDDSCQLYAALCSGPQCYIVSNDLFRNYRQQLRETVEQGTSALFNKYQMSRQLTLMDGYRRRLTVSRCCTRCPPSLGT